MGIALVSTADACTTGASKANDRLQNFNFILSFRWTRVW